MQEDHPALLRDWFKYKTMESSPKLTIRWRYQTRKIFQTLMVESIDMITASFTISLSRFPNTDPKNLYPKMIANASSFQYWPIGRTMVSVVNKGLDTILSKNNGIGCEQGIKHHIEQSVHKPKGYLLERKLENVNIESDYLTAMNLVTEGNPSHHPLSVLINEAYQLMALTNTSIGHIFRLANQCADYLARLGAKHPDVLMFIMDMPIALREFVIKNSLNIKQLLD